MNAVLLLAPLLGRENDGPTSLCFALLLLLLPNPRAIANVGLQLSFAAVAGLQLFSGGLTGWLEGLLRVAACGSAIRSRRGCCARSVRRLRPRSVHWPSRCRWPRGISGRSHWLLR